MISRGQIVARLREEDYRYYERKKRVEIYRRPGPVWVTVPIHDLFTPDEARAILKQARLTDGAIDRFLLGCVHSSVN